MDYLKKKWYTSFIFVIPALVFYISLGLLPILASVYYSLCKWNGVSPPEFTGLSNYIFLFSNEDFQTVLSNTLVCMFWSLLIQLTAGICFAYLIFRTGRRLQKAYRALTFLPAVVSASSIALMFVLLFNSEVGPVNNLLERIGLASLTRNWLSDANVVLYVIITPMIYQFIGYYVVIMLAGMQSIPEDVFESASLDGANSLQIFLKIVIPTQVNIIVICSVLILSGALKSFEHSYIMTSGGPGVQSAFMGVYMYTTTFLGGKFGQGSSVSILIMIFAITVAMILNGIGRKFEY